MKTAVFEALGIRWDRSLFPMDVFRGEPLRAVRRFQRTLPRYVWDAAQLEGNPYTFPEVQTLLDGVTVGGHTLSDTRQILGLRDSLRLVCDEVIAGTFAPSRAMACRLNDVIARDEALEWGHFRGEGRERSNVAVALGEKSYAPKPTEAGGRNLVAAYERGAAELTAHVEDPFERALALNFFMCREQFFFDGNRRTARAMMNGELMRHGVDDLSVPAAKRLGYNEAMARFYPSGEATEMMVILAACLPDPMGT